MQPVLRKIWRFIKQACIGLALAAAMTFIILAAYKPAFQGALTSFMALAPEPLGEFYYPDTFQLLTANELALHLAIETPDSPDDLAATLPLERSFHSLFFNSVLVKQDNCTALLIARQHWHGFWYTIERRHCND